MKTPLTYRPKSDSTNIGGYRYFFNGQEGDNEVFGENSLFAFEYRMHDARLGRFWSVDPLAVKYPWNSTYAFAENDVIRAIDVEGLEKWITQTSQLSYGPYSLEYVTSNNYRLLQDVIQSDQLIDAVEQAQTSQTFTSLQTKAKLVEFTVTNDKTGTWTNAASKQINIDHQANTTGMIQGLAWEMTNATFKSHYKIAGWNSRKDL
jgi:RHS repeat-associated protein